MEAIGKFFVSMILTILSILIRGWVVMKIWAWFIVPTFELNPLRMIEALGLSLTVALLTAQLKFDPDAETGFDAAIGNFLFVIFANLLFLFMGWIYSLFM